MAGKIYSTGYGPSGNTSAWYPFDPIARAVFEEELTLTALASHRDYEAISYMDAWLRASSEDERGATSLAVAGLVERRQQRGGIRRRIPGRRERRRG